MFERITKSSAFQTDMTKYPNEPKNIVLNVELCYDRVDQDTLSKWLIKEFILQNAN